VSISKNRVITMPTAVQPGVTTFSVTSAAKRGSIFQVVLPAAGYTPAQASKDIEKGVDGGNVNRLKNFEANTTLLGGAPADDTADTLIVDLDPGVYWALDIRTSKAGKFFPFTVSGLDSGNVMPTADATIKAKQATKWAGNPRAIPNKGLMNFKNTSSENHFIVMFKLKKGKTYADFKKWFLAEGGPAGPPPANFEIGLDTGVLSPGHSAQFNYRLPKGDYVLLCFWPDAEMDAMPHAFMGMHRPITLK
jgi:hypothetical protein